MNEHNTILDSFVGIGLDSEVINNPDEYTDLYKERFRLSDLEISARVLMHWKKMGLLPDKPIKKTDEQDNESEKGKLNRFNFFELIYLYILQDLREIGFSIDKLKKVKATLLAKTDIMSLSSLMDKESLNLLKKHGYNTEILEEFLKHKQDIEYHIDEVPDFVKFPTALDSIILGVLQQKLDFRLIISMNGDVEAEVANSLGQVEKTISNAKPHVVLTLFHYLYRFLSNKKYSELYVSYKLLDQQEMAILDHVRKGQYKEIKIKFNKKDSILLELTEERKIDNAARLQDILLKGGYQDIQLKTQKGVITYTTIKTKKQI